MTAGMVALAGAARAMTALGVTRAFAGEAGSTPGQALLLTSDTRAISASNNRGAEFRLTMR